MSFSLNIKINLVKMVPLHERWRNNQAFNTNYFYSSISWRKATQTTNKFRCRGRRHYVFGLSAFLSNDCEHVISRTSRRNFLKYGANLQLDLKFSIHVLPHSLSNPPFAAYSVLSIKGDKKPRKYNNKKELEGQGYCALTKDFIYPVNMICQAHFQGILSNLT